MPLFAVPRYSTLGIAALINCLVKRMPSDYAYLNIGVWNGFTLLAGIVGNPTRSIIGVDNFSEFGGPREDFLRRFERQRSSKHQFFDMDYRLFFSSHPNVKVGLYYYDGPHTYGDQYDALSLADPYLVDGAIVMVDDANWQEPRQATLDFVQRHEGKYALVLDLKTRNNGHPTYWNGLMILCKRTASR